METYEIQNNQPSLKCLQISRFFQRFSKLFKAENEATIKDAQDAQKAIAQAAWGSMDPDCMTSMSGE